MDIWDKDPISYDMIFSKYSQLLWLAIYVIWSQIYYVTFQNETKVNDGIIK